ncbi:transmembrane O-methyltransferase homolog [Cynoglossus semilaevis]|uniref:catechol O-methyltransferase n=1 Tax=Cynoglossus semilaevis TaxID=244447 RepID=A0A3P8UXG8_CYNSE|nr:transmembrane O-methyltransferase homolog [Cynoglossus semilaevis]XP_016894738.1 transmembrane O-methyltransferase homolog [Cynoglossus semilaevis]XP_016894739.1 transmembrane O-methyltransferase homolog [Cynoglossus semilaevis]
MNMWLLAVSVPLLPAIIMLSTRCRHRVSSLYHKALAWARKMVGGKVCVRRTHAFVFTQCTHGKVDSVLETFDLYAAKNPSLAIDQDMGKILDEAVMRLHPSSVLELGMHCGYSSVRMLRLLPPTGKLITVEMDPLTADLGEEIILVSGFKHHQFQVLTSSSANIIRTLHLFLDQNCRKGLDLVLMDHDPQQYLPDLLALQKEELLCSSGCSILFINRTRGSDEDLREVLAHVTLNPKYLSIGKHLPFILEVLYKKDD